MRRNYHLYNKIRINQKQQSLNSWAKSSGNTVLKKDDIFSLAFPKSVMTLLQMSPGNLCKNEVLSSHNPLGQTLLLASGMF